MISYFVLITFVSCTLGLVFRAILIHRSMFDLPKSRGMHTVPMPRAGIGMVVTILAGLIGAASAFQSFWLAALAVAVAILSGVGFIDDLVSLNVRPRLIAQCVVALLLVFGIGHIETLVLGSIKVELGWFGIVLSLIGVVWVFNLFNFMDGINGLSLTQSLFFSSSTLLLLSMTALHSSALESGLLIMCASILGTLPLNFPRPLLFLGDAGSTALGVVAAGFMLFVVSHTPELLWTCLILLAMLVTDATFTLLNRIRLGNHWSQAHNLHVYQKLAKKVESHTVVTLFYFLVALLWLLPLAYLSIQPQLNGLVLCLFAYIPLVFTAWKARAGQM